MRSVLNRLKSLGQYKALGVIARICVVAAIYALIFRKADIKDVGSLLTPTFGLGLALAVLLYSGQGVMCTLRWVALARKLEHRPPIIKSVAAYFEGLFFNQALPSFVGGDAIRILRWRSFGVSLHDAAVSVVRDRMFGAIGAALFALVASILLWSLPVERYKVWVSALLSLAALFAGAGLLLVIQSRRITRLFATFPRIHARLHRISAEPLGKRIYAEALVMSVLGQAMSGVAVLVLARSINIELSSLLIVTITGVIVVMSMIPISLAGWGVREAGFLALLVPLGVDREQAVLLGVSFGLAGLISAMSGGLSLLTNFSTRKVPAS